MSKTATPEHQSPADLVGEWLNHTAHSLGSAGHRVEAAAVSLETSIHLPDVQFFDSTHESVKPAEIDSSRKSPKPAEKVAASAQASHPSIVAEAASAAKELSKVTLNEMEHKPLQAAEAAAFTVAAPDLATSKLVTAALVAHPALLTGAENVAKELGKGALNEVEHQPLQLVETAVVGLAAGAVIAGAATLAVGTGVIAAPVLAVAGTVVGVASLGYGAYQAYENREVIIHDTEAVANPNAYSAKDVAQARQSVENTGGDGVVQGVGFASSLAGGMIGGALAASASDDAVTAAKQGANYANNLLPDVPTPAKAVATLPAAQRLAKPVAISSAVSTGTATASGAVSSSRATTSHQLESRSTK